MGKLLALVLLVAVPAAAAVAQSFCGSPRKTATAVSNATATAVPTAKLALRAQIEVCNTSLNAGSGVLACREDGVDPIMLVTSAGDVIAKGSCRTYRIPSGTTLKCLSDVNGTVAAATECK